MPKAWLYLAAAGVCEIIWAVCLKYSQGFSRALPTVAIFVFGYLSFYLLSEAALTIPIGTAYAVWTGIGRSAPPFWASSCSPSRSTGLGCCSFCSSLRG